MNALESGLVFSAILAFVSVGLLAAACRILKRNRR